MASCSLSDSCVLVIAWFCQVAKWDNCQVRSQQGLRARSQASEQVGKASRRRSDPRTEVLLRYPNQDEAGRYTNALLFGDVSSVGVYSGTNWLQVSWIRKQRRRVASESKTAAGGHTIAQQARLTQLAESCSESFEAAANAQCALCSVW